MASNPMQRKARISFLLGVVFTLLIAAVIIFLMMQKTNKLNADLQRELNSKSTVYVLNQDVVSGQTITSDMFTQMSVSNTAIPQDATGDISATLGSYALSDVDGHSIFTEIDEQGKPYMFMEIENEQGTMEKVTVTTDENKEKYYKNNTEEIELAEKPLLFKIALKANTVMTGNMIVRSDKMLKDNVREETYNMISLPIDLISGEYVDIRLKMPNGTDFIVLPKTEVTIPDINGELLSDTIKIDITEEELLTLSCAIVEAYRTEGSVLYAIKYKEAGLQNAAQITYKPSEAIVKMIDNNPNVVQKAKNALKEAYNQTVANSYRVQLDKYSASGNAENVTSGNQESTQAKQEAREEYLTSIYGGTVTTTSGATE